MSFIWIFLPLLMGFGPLESPKGFVEEGNALFIEGKYDEAKEKYEAAAKIAKDDAPIKYNRANTLFKQGDLEGALKDYREGAAFGDEALKAKSFYNMGNALFAGQKFNEAAAAFKEALKHDPSDNDAKINLEMALKKMEEQKEQQKQKNKDENKEDGEKQDQEQQQDQEQKQEGQDNKEDRADNGEDEKTDDRKEEGEKPKDDSAPQMKEGEKKEMSKEEAERVLENLGDQNMDLQNMADMLKSSKPTQVEKDW
ncbi:MAG: tetratricopeptide repeat protein [Proteobacteria bacterium]|nr:tetratricopeptide repeat protein [Pseudomonadota bacterium]